jgi:hypothetical protein
MGARRRWWLRAIQCRSPRHIPTGAGVPAGLLGADGRAGATALAQFGDRVEYRVCDLRDSDWPAQVGGSFDAVVSALAIHNLGEPAAIRKAFVDIANLLRAGGCFFDLDLVLDMTFAPPGSALGELYARGGPIPHHSDADESHTTGYPPTSSSRRWKTTSTGCEMPASLKWTACGSSSPKCSCAGSTAHSPLTAPTVTGLAQAAESE